MTSVLFLCVHNSARSQMAEGLLRAWGGSAFEAFSAGSEPTTVRPEAIAVMAELGIDISGQASKRLDIYLGRQFDDVVTLCEEATEACPYFPFAAAQLHWPIPDPAAASAGGEVPLAAFRCARDAIGRRIRLDLLDRG
jgi:arsenate reductase